MYLIDVKQGLWDSLEKCECIDDIGSRNIFSGKTVAITGIFQKLDKSICRTCTKRIFRECQSVEHADAG
jgi:SulP family sulfate permease